MNQSPHSCSYPQIRQPLVFLFLIGTSRCGGSLVNEWYVVTAGHCVARARASQVRVTLGEYVLKSSAEPLPGRTYGVSRIKVHPYFKFTPQADRSVVAISVLMAYPQ